MARRAFGPQRLMTPAQKAKNVIASIEARIEEDRPWSLDDYGLPAGSEQRQLVEQWIRTNTKAAA